MDKKNSKEKPHTCIDIKPVSEFDADVKKRSTDTVEKALKSNDEEEKLGRVKDQLTKRAEGKAKRAEERKKKRKSAKKGLNERFRDKFKFITQLFQSNKAEKTKKQNVGNVTDGDITYGGEGNPDDVEDVWIEDPAILQYKAPSHVLLVKNNDNNGQLFPDGKRPFWKMSHFTEGHLPAPKEKPSSVLLTKFLNCDEKLDPYLDPPEEFDVHGADINVFLERDERYFHNPRNMLSNTIRSVIATMADDKKGCGEAMSEVMTLMEPESRCKVETRRDLKVTIMPDPTEMLCYYRHNLELQPTKEAFKKSAPGKPKKRAKTS